MTRFEASPGAIEEVLTAMGVVGGEAIDVGEIRQVYGRGESEIAVGAKDWERRAGEEAAMHTPAGIAFDAGFVPSDRPGPWLM